MTDHEIWLGEAAQCRQNATRLERQAKRLDKIADSLGEADQLKADALVNAAQNCLDQAHNELQLAATLTSWATGEPIDNSDALRFLARTSEDRS
jgi:hypothetical protein